MYRGMNVIRDSDFDIALQLGGLVRWGKKGRGRGEWKEKKTEERKK